MSLSIEVSKYRIKDGSRRTISRASLQTILTGISINLYEAQVSTGKSYTNVAWPTTNVTAMLGLTITTVT